MLIPTAFLLLLGSVITRAGFINSHNSISGPCTYDNDCPTPNSFCKNHRECACKQDYEYDQTTDVCFPAVIGTICTEQFFCQRLKNSDCINNQCKCGRDMVVSQDKTSCLPLSRLSGLCTEDAQCITHTPHSHCNFTSGLCDCDPNYHNAEGPPECLINTGLDFPCNATRECYIDAANAEALVCKTDEEYPVFKKCQCTSGFTREGSKCKKSGSAQAVLSFATFSLCLFFIGFMQKTP